MLRIRLDLTATGRCGPRAHRKMCERRSPLRRESPQRLISAPKGARPARRSNEFAAAAVGDISTSHISARIVL
jgi:hypothetical protein